MTTARILRNLADAELAKLTADAERALAKLYADTGIDLTSLPSVIKPDELAPVLRTTVGALSQDRYRGTGVPYVKHGKRVRYLRADVARYLSANRSGN
jgi:hypothetical protein